MQQLLKNIMNKYPIEIEFTDFCWLKCNSCINPILSKKWNISLENYIFFLDYLYKNLDNILYIDLAWIWDIFLHPNISLLLEKFIDKFKDTWLNVLIPTKWQSIKEEHIKMFKEFKNNWINLNISIWIYSTNKQIHDRLSGVENFEKVLYFIKKLKQYNINFTLELLKSNYSIKQEDIFMKLLNKIWIKGTIHNYHNFWWLILNDEFIYGEESSSFNWDNFNLNWFYCSFIPFISKNFNLYTCSVSWKNKKFFVWNFEELTIKYPNYIDLVNYIKETFLSSEKCNNCSIFKSYQLYNEK